MIHAMFTLNSSVYSMKRILISGINGRIGQAIKKNIESKFAVYGHLRSEDLSHCIESVKPDIIIDVTSSNSIKAHLAIYLQHKIPTIIGTSGLSPQEAFHITETCHFPLLIIPNFSQSFQFFLQQAKVLHYKYPAYKIIETHCNTKVDSPSSSSLFLSHALNNAPIRSLRISNYIAKHEIYFGQPSNHMTLAHTINEPKDFIPGVIAAINYIQTMRQGQVFI